MDVKIDIIKVIFEKNGYLNSIQRGSVSSIWIDALKLKEGICCNNWF